MSRRIRTRHGAINLASGTIHLGVKSVRVGGRNVWKQAKDKLERLSNEAENHSGENQAIARVQKRILRHAPQTLRCSGKIAKGTVKLAAKGASTAAKRLAHRTTNRYAPKATGQQQKNKIRSSIPRRIRSRTWNMTKSGAKRLVIRGKNAGLSQIKNVIRTKQDEAAKRDAKNYASAKAEQTAATTAPKVMKGASKVIRLGGKGVFTVSRKTIRFVQSSKEQQKRKITTRKHAKDKALHKMDLTQKRDSTQSHLRSETTQKNKQISDPKNQPQQPQPVNQTNRQQATAHRRTSTTQANQAQDSKNANSHSFRQKSFSTKQERTIRTKAQQRQFRSSSIRSHQSKAFRTRADQQTITATNRQSVTLKRAKTAAIKKTKNKAEKRIASQAVQQAKAAAIRVMKQSAKVLEQTLKAIATAVKAIIAAVGGGAFFIGLVVLIAGAAFIFASPWGIFFGANNPGTHHIPQVVAELNAELMGNIQTTQTSADDELDIEGDSPVSNWIDVLGVFAVKTSTDINNPLDVGTMDDQKKAILKQVFLDMNEIVTTTETVTETDSQGNQTTKTVKRTRIVSKTWQQMIPIYGFNAEQEKLLTEIMQGEYYEMFIALLGLPPAQSSPLTAEELNIIAQDLPPGAKTSEIVKLALSKLSTTYDNDKRMLEGYYDCSSFVYRIYKSFGLEVGYPDNYVAASQGEWCVKNNVVISYNDLQPGDLVFFSSKPSRRFMSIDHVGIVRPGRTK